MDVLTRIKEEKIIAIMRGTNQEDVLSIVKALHKGGVNIIEITMNSPKALAAIEQVADEMGDKVLVGAGTVLDEQTARNALLAGAQFILAPSVNTETIQMTKRYGAVCIPGALTPTEILTAYESGADIVKVFPVSTLGSSYIKDVRGPLPHIPLLPTGGVNLENIAEFIKAGAVGVGLGSSLVNSKNDINDVYLEQLTNKARAFVKVIKSN